MLNLDNYPTIFTPNRNPITTTENYVHIPTVLVLEALQDNGWQPTKASQSNTNQAHREGFQKHAVVLMNERYKDLIGEVGQPRMTLKHAHDGTSALHLLLSLWIKVCMNGLHAFQDVSTARVLHRGFTIEKLLAAIAKFNDNLPYLARDVSTFRHITLSPTERLLLAQSAIELRYDPIVDAFGEPMRADGPAAEVADFKYPVTPQQMLTRRRVEDNTTNLWGTFNVIQENIIERPQVKAVSYNPKKNRFTERTVRPVGAIEANTKLNQGLWALAAKMAELKTGNAVALQ